jgi:hypothetical protein
MLDACACMGPRPGDEFCYCQFKARGLIYKDLRRTKHESR